MLTTITFEETTQIHARGWGWSVLRRQQEIFLLKCLYRLCYPRRRRGGKCREYRLELVIACRKYKRRIEFGKEKAALGAIVWVLVIGFGLNKRLVASAAFGATGSRSFFFGPGAWIGYIKQRNLRFSFAQAMQGVKVEPAG